VRHFAKAPRHSTPRRLRAKMVCEAINIMDIERINLIGTQIADLTRRTEALRGYL